jgi:hypothetical protein
LGGVACSDNLPVFRTANRAIGSDDSLAAIIETYSSDVPELDWSGALRYEALKVFVEITDDDSSWSGNAFDTSLRLQTEPSGIFGDETTRNYVFHSVVGVTPGSPTVECTSAANTGAQYQVLTDLTDGLLLSVCALDFAPHFSTIANAIDDAVRCAFTPPEGAAGGFTLRLGVEGGANLDIPRVDDEGACRGAGWHYDDEAAPELLLLCPSTCAALKANLGSRIEVVEGCG